MLTSDDLKKLADLSRLSVSDEEIEIFRTEIDAILSYVQEVSSVPGQAQNTLPKHRNALRDDVSPHASGEHTETLFAQVSRKDGAYLQVKKIL